MCLRNTFLCNGIPSLGGNGSSLELVNSSGEDEIIFGEAVDLVRVKGNFYLSPGEEDIGVMALLLGDGAYLISEFQSRFEVGERERPSDVMFAHGFPAACMLDQPIELTPLLWAGRRLCRERTP